MKSTKCSSTTCKVPAENLVGEENKGWNYAKFLLGNERSGIARVGASKSRIRRLKQLAAIEQAGGKPLIADERFRAKIAAVEIELKALEMTQLRVVAAERRRDGNDKPDPASSILKIKGSEIQQAITELLLEVVGPYGLPDQIPARGHRSLERAAGRSRLGRAAGAAIFQLSKDVDLRRLERNSETNHRQGDTGIVRWISN